jgi:RND superfamily putative drug exporter
VLLLIGLRTPVAAFILAGFGTVTTLTGFGAMALLGKVIETDPLAVALASITGLALGVGYSLLIVDRFREEGMAAAGVVTTAGRAVLLSGTALILALILATAIAPTPILTSIGIGVLLCSALATGAAVVVMPAVLTLLGSRSRRSRSPRRASSSGAGTGSSAAGAGSPAGPYPPARSPPRRWSRSRCRSPT